MNVIGGFVFVGLDVVARVQSSSSSFLLSVAPSASRTPQTSPPRPTQRPAFMRPRSMVSPDGFPSSRPGGHYQGGSPVHRRPGTSLSRKSGAAAAPTSPAPTVRQHRRQAARPAQGAHSVKQRHRASKHSETSTRPPRSGRLQITATRRRSAQVTRGRPHPQVGD